MAPVLAGTDWYMAPEVMEGKAYDEKVDVYSFGLVMWETFEEKVPFLGFNPIQLALAVLSGKRPEFEKTPRGYRQLIERCWAAEPSQRPSMQEVLAGIREVQVRDAPQQMPQMKPPSAGMPPGQGFVMPPMPPMPPGDGSPTAGAFVLPPSAPPQTAWHAGSPGYVAGFEGLDIGPAQSPRVPPPLPPRNPSLDSMLEEAEELLARGDVRGAHSMYVRSASDYPNPFSHLGIRACYSRDPRTVKRPCDEDPSEVQVKKGREAARNFRGPALSKLRERAEAGSLEACFMLGNACFFGVGMEKNTREATKWYLRGAERGHAHCRSCIGYCYVEGAGVEKDLSQSARYFRLAAEARLPVGMCNVGYLYDKGDGCEKDQMQAIRWWRAAVDTGYSDAACDLGIAYEKGNGVVKDVGEAARLYRVAAEGGDPYAQCNLGWFYENGTGVVKDKREAMRYYRLSAAQGNARAKRLLNKLEGR